MLGNFLKIDYIVVCFLKSVNSACFVWVMIEWVANRLDFRPAGVTRRLAWTQPVCIRINAVPALKGLMAQPNTSIFFCSTVASDLFLFHYPAVLSCRRCSAQWLWWCQTMPWLPRSACSRLASKTPGYWPRRSCPHSNSPLSSSAHRYKCLICLFLA